MILSLPAVGRGQTLLPGLVADYSDGSRRVRLVVPSPNFHLEPGESVHPALSRAFEAEWEGLLTILRSGSYTFQCAAEVVVDGKDARREPVQLEPGRHPIRVRFRRTRGAATVRLLWQSGEFPWEPLPASLFSHAAENEPSIEEAMVERGRFLVEEYGCINCHLSSSPSLRKRWGPKLTGIAARVKPGWLYPWLIGSGARRAGTVMPDMLDAPQSRDVAWYLASLGGLRSPEAEGSPLPPDAALRGRRLYGTLGCATCHQPDRIPLDGIGSKMPVAALASYLKEPSKVDPSGRMPSMMLSDEEASDLASFLVQSRNESFEGDIQTGDAVRGREIVRHQGCLACHTLEDPDPVQNGRRAPGLEELAPDRGCLSAEPRGVPRYRLGRDAVADIQSFLRRYRRQTDRSPAPVYDFRRDVERLQCTACHETEHRRPWGSPAEAAPPLTETGAKLRTDWISGVLTGRNRVLEWMNLRMPAYDASVVASLIRAFPKAAGVEPGDGAPAPPATDAERTRGVELIGMNPGKGGMACLGCHDWGTYRSQGESGPQLMDVAQRLRYDWFERWMLNPTRILSGTSMPSYFRLVAPEQALTSIRTLWASLSMGNRMPLPEGLRRAGSALGSEEKPVPGREVIVIRWDMPEATPAAIAVGMPGGLSYCFDAGESRLRYAWEGGFLDMSGTLHRKVDENRLTPTAQPIGTVFYRSEGFPFRVDSTQREPERRFRGYRLVDGYPRFHYQVEGIEVYERIVPAKGSAGITRQFHVQPVDRPMWFLSGPPDGITLSSTLGPFVDGRLEIPRGPESRFEVTVSKKE